MEALLLKRNINCSVEDLQKGRYLVDFPFAYYRLTAVLTTAQGAQMPLRLTFIPGAVCCICQRLFYMHAILF
jgi:hypothetical protein